MRPCDACCLRSNHLRPIYIGCTWQTHLLQLEDQLEERAAKVEVFSSARETDQQEGQRLAVRSAVERARLSNSMIQLRLCPTSHGTSHVLELPKDRRDAHDKELKAVFDRVDPQGQGRISLPSVKKAVTKMVPSPPPPSRRPRSVTASSQSMPSLYKPALKEKSTASLHEKCMAVFTAADTDGTGTISKRELMAALKKAGLNETRTALNMFQVRRLTDRFLACDAVDASDRRETRCGSLRGLCAILLSVTPPAGIRCERRR
jgi:Ca2+-binding EF-hand superfamily protein